LIRRELKYIRQLVVQMNKNNRRVAVTIVTAIFILLLYGIIFSFSGQDGTTSSGISHRISVACVDTVNKVAKQSWSEAYKRVLSDIIEPIIRKGAHFSEYALLGLLCYTLLAQWIVRFRMASGLLWVFLSACADEFHQTFVPGRDGNMIDVGIDSLGGLTGMLLWIGIVKLYKNIKNKRGR